MTALMVIKPDTSLIESVDKLFLCFLVGKTQIEQEDESNDVLAESESEKKVVKSKSNSPDGWNQRILLDVEKQRVLRELAEQKRKDKRNALLTRYFQQSLLKIINLKLERNNSLILEQMQLRESNLELLQVLLADEIVDTALAPLLEVNSNTRKQLFSLAGREKFMRELGRTPKAVGDMKVVIRLIGKDVLRYLVPAILFKSKINNYGQHNSIFAKKLWRYELTLGQTCTSLMITQGYQRPYEGLLLSALVNLGYVASYQQYLNSFAEVRNACLEQAREKGDKHRHDFFYNMQTDPASLQALLISQSSLQLSLSLAEKLFMDSFPHLVDALREEVTSTPFETRSELGQILFKALRFAKYDQLRAARLFKPEWLDKYLHQSLLSDLSYNSLLRQELFRFKPTW